MTAVSRQKSCDVCVRGKRRCDKRKPRCTRCAVRGLDCGYPPPKTVELSSLPRSRPAADAPTDASTDTSTSFLPIEGESHLGLDADSSLGSDTTTESRPRHSDGARLLDSGILDSDMLDPEDSDTAAGGDQGQFSLDDLMAGVAGSHHAWDVAGMRGIDIALPPAMCSMPRSMTDSMTHSIMDSMTASIMAMPSMPSVPSMQQPHGQPQPKPLRDLAVLQSIATTCFDADPVQVYDAHSRLGSIVAFLRSLGTDFGQTRTLPFIHERLWFSQAPAPGSLCLPSDAGGSGPPALILTAFSAAATYSSRTAQTTVWALRTVADAAREVLKLGEQAASPRERLARVQALAILCVMRFFDGDVGLRAAAERDLATLLAWVKDLEALRDELEAEARAYSGLVPLTSRHLSTRDLKSRDAPPKSWETWIFLESTRRSVIMGYAYICLSYILKSEEPSRDMWSNRQTFTTSRHLWDASSSVEFYRAWQEKPQFLVENMSFRDVWLHARPADIDEFTRLMFVGQIGPDAMDHFMHGDVSIPV